MRSKKKIAVGGGRAASQTTQNVLSLQSQLCFEGETLTRFLKSVHREIKSARAVDETLPLKFWFKQQFAVGVNEVTCGLERMPRIEMNVDDSEAQCVYFQITSMSFGWIVFEKHTKRSQSSARKELVFNFSRVPIRATEKDLIFKIYLGDIGVKAKGSAINRVIEEALTDNKINRIEDEAMEA